MTTDLRHLLAIYVHAHRTGNSVPPHIDAEARTALADEPAVPEGREPVAVAGQSMPTDAELLCTAAKEIDGYGNGINPGDYEPSTESAVEVYGSELCAYARAVLAHWGNSAPQPPAEGEVAELVRMLTGIAHWRRRGRPGEGDPSPFDIRQADRLDRAADLLQHLSPPQPVPVSERLPGQEDCDVEGRCWWLHVGGDGVGDWFQRAPYPSVTSYAFFRMTHWLPAYALPVPGQEVEG